MSAKRQRRQHRRVKRLADGRGADLVVDVGGAETLARSVRATRMAGTVTVTGVLTGFNTAPLPIGEVLFNSIRIIGVTVGSVRSFVELCELISQALIRPHVSYVFEWTDLTEAVRVLAAGEHVGNGRSDHPVTARPGTTRPQLCSTT
jgi:NADPH:quinone reductase-like Zn-dependent oxidoreductase